MDGRIVGSDNIVKEISQSDYDNLSDAEKTNGTYYLVKDTTADDYQALLKLMEVVGDEQQLTGIADGT